MGLPRARAGWNRGSGISPAGGHISLGPTHVSGVCCCLVGPVARLFVCTPWCFLPGIGPTLSPENSTRLPEGLIVAWHSTLYRCHVTTSSWTAALQRAILSVCVAVSTSIVNLIGTELCSDFPHVACVDSECRGLLRIRYVSTSFGSLFLHVIGL